MASTVWKGYVSFGLVSIPIRLFAAARDERISFNQIHRVCGSRVKQQLFCPHCERIVERSELARGYEAEKDRYVLIEDEDIKKIAPPSSETMDIVEFVHLKEIDPVYFDASYYVVAEGPGKKAYSLLMQSMQKLGFVALAKVAMHQREQLVVLRPFGKGLTLHTMYFANEVRQISEYGHDADVELKPQELQLAEKLIESLSVPFEPEKYKDEYQEKLQELVRTKDEGKAAPATAPRRLAPVIDLMQALQASLSKESKSSGSEETAERKPPQTTAKRRKSA